MERFHVYVKQTEEKSTIPDIVDFIPFGRENAISRAMLLDKCVTSGLCNNDRTMRGLLEKAKIDCVILAREEGGYYRPTHDDLLDLNRYIRQETHRAISVFLSIKRAKALYEDFKRGIL